MHALSMFYYAIPCTQMQLVASLCHYIACSLEIDTSLALATTNRHASPDYPPCLCAFLSRQ